MYVLYTLQPHNPYNVINVTFADINEKPTPIKCLLSVYYINFFCMSSNKAALDGYTNAFQLKAISTSLR